MLFIFIPVKIMEFNKNRLHLSNHLNGGRVIFAYAQNNIHVIIDQL